MLKKIIKKLTAWSYSRWRDYDKCPAYAKFKHVERRKEPDSPATAHGSAVHKASDDYVSGKKRLFPKELRGTFAKEFKKIAKNGAQTEQEWAFTSEWERCNWFDWDRCRVRIKVDIVWTTEERKGKGLRETTVVVVDIKTGKVHDDHEMQRSLYAVGALLVYPDAMRVVVQHWYLDTGDVHESVFTAKQMYELRTEWEKRVKPMLNDKRFSPRPGVYCRWCFFRKGNGGPCQF